MSVRTVVALASAAILSQPGPDPTGLPSFAEPAISPDGREIAFASGGDIWTVPSAGGDARLLVSHAATESRPQWSPDGGRLAFASTRTGAGDIYVLSLESGELTRLTWDDAPEQVDGWSADGEWIYFTSNSRDIAGMNDVLRVRPSGGTPLPFSDERYTSEFFAAPSPDGTRVAVSARGNAAGQWWRRGHSHLDESEIWVVGPTPAKVVDRGAKALWPMWAADGKRLYFMSDRDGAENIWMTAYASGSEAQAQRLTSFTDGRVLWPTISRDGKTIAFERNFGIWTLNTATGQAAQVKIRRLGAPASTTVEHLRLTSQIRELALSPDGKKILFTVRGEVFAASAKDGGDAARVTTTAGNEAQVTWAPDSKRAIYASDRDGLSQLFLYDFGTQTETRLTTGTVADYAPTFSPDGKMLAFIRDRTELRVIDLDGKTERLIASGMFGGALDAGRPIAFSPDNQWIAYLSASNRMFTNAWIAPAKGGTARQVSFVGNVNGDSLAWSPDGTFLTFTTGQRTERGQAARVDLILRTPKFREDQFRDLFQEPAKPSTPPTPPATQPAQAPAPVEVAAEKKEPKKPVEIVFADIRRRLSLVNTGLDIADQTISPDGKWLLITADAAGQQNLYLYSIDELSREPAVARQVTSTPGVKASPQFSPDTKEIYYLDDGTVRVAPVERGESRRVNVTAEFDVDFATEKMEVFHQAWTLMRDYFFDPKMNGVNWDESRRRFGPRVAGARTPDEMRRVIAQMIGELNASHLGINPPPGQVTPSTGRLGLRFDAREYEQGGGLKITEVLPLGPAALVRTIEPGHYLLAVDGAAIDARTNLDRLLDHKIDRRVMLTIGMGQDGKSRMQVAVRPVNLTTEKGLLYRHWVEQQRAYVLKASNGRLGYVHMLDMGAASLDQLHLDLDAENFARDGVVVDVRNNNGGFVNVYAIDVLARRSYFTMTLRGAAKAPARTILGQRSLELPTVLVTNQHSLSDAEDFTEGYRSLKLGKVVGEPTSGWIIYTSNTRLIDGSVFRLPQVRITAMDGTEMEMHPRPVDVPVTRALGESRMGKDSQLDAAVRVLLDQLGAATNTRSHKDN
jgi:Tol biopolymer transport system component/C-terminal processing protease CtpA/Prc